MEDLQETALKVIRALKSIEGVKYSNLRVAVIGGLARMHYNHRGRDTRDVDFIVDTPGMTIPPGLRSAIVALAGSDFIKKHDTLYREYKTSQGDTRYHQVDFVPRDVRVQDIPDGVIPYISRTDLIVFKLYSCGLRGQPDKGFTDALDAKDLLETLTAPLALTTQQKTIVEDGIKDVMRHLQDIPQSWWRERLGLPEEDGELDNQGDDERDDANEGRRRDNEDEEEGGEEEGASRGARRGTRRKKRGTAMRRSRKIVRKTIPSTMYPLAFASLFSGTFC
ncbi:hypothetical protein C8A03DRAFT_37754 [Achaetomium macrosporum]|uniref:Nucleotidyltransferase n=1 Tax=Achaetomium macrosporum TaxID=79813 RepID=A0AAN7HAV8_9PEZI|nr:hypothetical protein C8A03DRAFT_37754 [Achaetomium macrosporum]